MKTSYFVTMFLLCFLVWVFLVDNAVLPGQDSLRQDSGAYTRYRVKRWNKGGKLDHLIPDELLVYAVVKNREQLYYMEYQPHFETSLKILPEETPVQLRYVNRFPKFWKRQLYEVRTAGRMPLGYSPVYLAEKQKGIWKTTGIVGGIFLFLLVLGLINNPGRR